MTDQSERSFFRVHGQAGLCVRRLSAEGWESLERAIRADWSAPEEAPDSELTRWLDRVERKLDILLAHLQVPNPERALRTEPREVIISGGGISFDSDEAFEAGDRLQIDLELGVPVVWIRCLGRVVRSEACAKGAKVVASFEVIREVDRDRIIEFALETERRAIQDGKGSAAA